MLTHTLEVPQTYHKYFLAIYDTTVSQSTYTGSENIDITNEIPLSFLLEINDEIVLNPRVNDYFEIYSAPNGISFLQHNSDGFQPTTIFNSLDKSVEFSETLIYLICIIKLK